MRRDGRSYIDVRGADAPLDLYDFRWVSCSFFLDGNDFRPRHGLLTREISTSETPYATFPGPESKSHAYLEPASPPSKRAQRHDALADGEHKSSKPDFFPSDSYISNTIRNTENAMWPFSRVRASLCTQCRVSSGRARSE